MTWPWQRGRVRELEAEVAVRDKMLVAYHRVAAAWWAWELATADPDEDVAVMRDRLREASTASQLLALDMVTATAWPLPREAHLGATKLLPPAPRRARVLPVPGADDAG